MRGERVRFRLPRPSARMTQMSPTSLRRGLTRYATLRPPGDHDGENSSSVVVVRRFGSAAPDGRT